MNKTHTNVEGIVEEKSIKTFRAWARKTSAGQDEDGETDIYFEDLPEYDQMEWQVRMLVREALQSQAEEYQKEKEEVMKLIYEIILDEESRMYFEQLARKYGVDLSE